ncbi:hypothetical protein [Aliiroseovarius sp. S253]|uniref:hypothetical protein n=1 Tax=Aliiroseovarius sp. S253 TaxID=3415133 RepID=UPI003C7C2680
MKNYLLIALSATLLLSLTGFKPIQRAYNDNFRRGSLEGVVECMRLNSNSVLSEEATKAACVGKHEIRLSPNGLEGKGGPRKDQENLSFEALLENERPDIVYTWVEINFVVVDADGTEKFHPVHNKVWLEPDATSEFNAVIDDFASADFVVERGCDTADKDKDCWGWGLGEVRGVKIK